MSSSAEQVINNRLEALEGYVQSNKISADHGAGERNLAKVVLDMEIFVRTLVADPPASKSEIRSLVDRAIKANIEI